MVEENWNAMKADEKTDHLREALKEAIEYRDAVIVTLEARIKILEERAARIEIVIASKH
jgi:hypothetical protein